MSLRRIGYDLSVLPTFSVLVSFAAVVAVLTVTPGLDTILVLRSAAVRGKKRAFGAIAGIQVGTFVWGFLAAVGVNAILLASAYVYNVVRMVGAAYLVWIGARMLWSAIRGTSSLDSNVAVADDSFVRGFRQGLLTNLLNPKVGVFYVALLPQFIPTTAPHITWGLALAGVHVLLGGIWLGSIALVAQRFQRWLQLRRVARTIDGVAGSAIIGFGVATAIEGVGRG